MHQDIFHLQFTNYRRLIKNLPPLWENAINFGYNVKSSDIACWDKWESTFPNPRLLISKTQ